MITRLQSRGEASIANTPQLSAESTKKPAAKSSKKPVAKKSKKLVAKKPVAEMCRSAYASVKPPPATASSQATIESAARKAANDYMHLNITRFTPTINQAVRISVTQALEEAVPDIVQKVVKEIELKQASTSSSSAPLTNGMPFQHVTPQELKEVKAALPGVFWYKCPRGHDYAVGECGRPVVHAQCVDCKVHIV